ncbi:MAG: hypothetical protein PUP93_06285 [Rhizonema sp. NSF051]|nr:hypothetical protein [Rhizonema sp. NSF051]
MNNQLKFPRFTIGFALLAVLMLSSCGQKSETPTASNDSSPAATPASSGAPVADTSGSAGTADTAGVKPSGTTCPSGSPVKGETTKKRGKIYIVTKSPDYAKAPVELCFKDTASAEKAGYKAPK